jgi:DNA transformation protein and related proteins
MAVDEGLVEWVREALEPIGTVTMRRMMGGAMLYMDGSVFALVHDGELWIKADAESNAIWDAAGHHDRFTVTFKDGSVDQMNYRRAPSETYDDADALRKWAGLGIAAGLRAPKKKPKVKKR